MFHHRSNRHGRYCDSSDESVDSRHLISSQLDLLLRAEIMHATLCLFIDCLTLYFYPNSILYFISYTDGHSSLHSLATSCHTLLASVTPP